MSHKKLNRDQLRGLIEAILSESSYIDDGSYVEDGTTIDDVHEWMGGITGNMINALKAAEAHGDPEVLRLAQEANQAVLRFDSLVFRRWMELKRK